MALFKLTETEQKIVFDCLKASADGPFFPEWEFGLLFGITREELRLVISQWPLLNDGDETVVLAVKNALGNLVGYPHGREEVWSDYISVSEDEVIRIRRKLG